MENTTSGTPHHELRVPRGLRGLPVADTGIGEVRGEEGFYHYRQYSAVELAVARPFEDVWRLVVDGELPTTLAERDAFTREVVPLRDLPEPVWAALPAIARVAEPMQGLRTALSLLASTHGFRPMLDLDATQRRHGALVLSAATPTLVAALHRLRSGLAPVPPRPDLGHGADLLWMLGGVEPVEAHARAIEQYLVTTIDHGFNASTFAARVVASTGSDLGSVVVAALGALAGPLHGGAPSRALELLEEIGTPERTERVVRARLAAGERIMGFGHAVYRTEDPRAALLREVAAGLGSPLADLAVEVERRVVRLLAEARPGRQLYANVEYYASVVMAACGVAPEVFTPTFASSRVVGWCAHALEQAVEGTVIRPGSRYVGPPAPRPVPELD